MVLAQLGRFNPLNRPSHLGVPLAPRGGRPDAVNPHSAATLSTLLLFFLSLAILAGLFATVHRREIETVKAYREKTRVDRMDRSIEQWLNGGFFRYGGMFLMDREQSIAFYPEQL